MVESSFDYSLRSLQRITSGKSSTLDPPQPIAMRKERKIDQEMKRYSFHGDCVRILEGEGIVLWISEFFQCTEKVMVR